MKKRCKCGAKACVNGTTVPYKQTILVRQFPNMWDAFLVCRSVSGYLYKSSHYMPEKRPSKVPCLFRVETSVKRIKKAVR